MKYVNLCNNPKGCCPSVGLPDEDEKYVVIWDDNNNRIHITKEQFKMLQKIKVGF